MFSYHPVNASKISSWRYPLNRITGPDNSLFGRLTTFPIADRFTFICRVKVLFLHQHFKTPYGGGAIRSYYLARALVDAGIPAVIITAHGHPYRMEIIDGIEVHYANVPYDNRFGFYRRSLAFFSFVWKAIRIAGTIPGVSVCYAMSVPLTVGIAARVIKRRYGIPYVFEVGDLWPDAPVQMGYIRNPVLRAWLFRLERKIYRNAHALVGLSPPIVETLIAKSPATAVQLIPNMSDTAYFFPTAKDPVLVEQFNVGGKFVIAYTGAIGVANGIDQLLLAARACRDNRTPVHFIICGDGALLPEIQQQARQLENVSILPFRDRNGVRDILNVSDAVFISYEPVPILETGSPNKYFDGLAAGKLIIVNFGGWIRSEIEERQCGVYADPHHPEDFPKILEPFLGGNRLTECQNNSRLLAEQKYSRSKLSQTFLELIKKTAPK